MNEEVKDHLVNILVDLDQIKQVLSIATLKHENCDIFDQRLHCLEIILKNLKKISRKVSKLRTLSNKIEIEIGDYLERKYDNKTSTKSN